MASQVPDRHPWNGQSDRSLRRMHTLKNSSRIVKPDHRPQISREGILGIYGRAFPMLCQFRNCRRQSLLRICVTLGRCEGGIRLR